MRLIPDLCFWFLAVVTCSAAPSRPTQNTNSVDIQGVRAQRYLMNGATRFRSLSPRVTIFTKSGGYQNAVADFFSLKPTNVKTVYGPDATREIAGQLGQHSTLSLKTGKPLFPQIQITSYEPGKDPEYNYYIKAFWYIGQSPEDQRSNTMTII